LEVLTLLLTEHPAGFSEHQLLRLLQQAPHEFFAADALRDPLILFQTHFLLFHCLYVLKQNWAVDNHAQLEISALRIIKQPIIQPRTRDKNTEEKSPQLADPLAQYYLDWSHFSTTSSGDVEALLNNFWQKVFVPQHEEDIKTALQLMELDAPIPTVELKVQYRRLAQLHHPDKGGDSDIFKQICQAFHRLKQYNLHSL
jgi:DNA-J related protein